MPIFCFKIVYFIFGMDIFSLLPEAAKLGWEKSGVQNLLLWPLGFPGPQFHQMSKRGNDSCLGILRLLWGVGHMRKEEKALHSWALHTSEISIWLNPSGRFSSTSISALFSLRFVKCVKRLSLAIVGFLLSACVNRGTTEHKACEHLQSVRATWTVYIRAHNIVKESKLLPTTGSS